MQPWRYQVNYKKKKKIAVKIKHYRYIETEKDPVGFLGMEAFMSLFLISKTAASRTFPKFQKADLNNC